MAKTHMTLGTLRGATACAALVTGIFLVSILPAQVG